MAGIPCQGIGCKRAAQWQVVIRNHAGKTGRVSVCETCLQEQTFADSVAEAKGHARTILSVECKVNAPQPATRREG